MASPIAVTRLHDYAGHKDCIYRLEQGAADSVFFSGAGEGWIVQWDLKKDDAPGKLIAKLPGSIFSLHYLAEKNHLLAGHRVGGIHLLDLNSNEEARNIQQPGTVFDMKCVPQHNLLAIGMAGGQLAFYTLDDLTEIRRGQYGDGHLRSFAVHPSGNYLAGGFSDQCIRFIDAASLEVVRSFEAHDNSVFSVLFDPNGDWLYSGGRDAHLKIWDLRSGTPELFLSIPAHLFTINFLALSPSGQYLASASRDKTVKIWDTHTWKLVKVIDREKAGGHAHSVNTLFWSAWESRLVSAGDDKIVKVWDLDI